MTARRAVEAAVELAKMSDAKLNIVTAYKPQPVRTPDLPAEFLDANYLPPADSLLDELLWVAKRPMSRHRSMPRQETPPKQSSRWRRGSART